MVVSAAPLPARAEPVQDPVQVPVMAVAHLDGAGVRVGGVDVVVVNQALAWADGAVEEVANGAVVAREVPPPLRVVDRSFHRRSPIKCA